MVKIKLFSSGSLDGLQYKIDEWVKTEKVNIISTSLSNSEMSYDISIVYEQIDTYYAINS